MAGGSLFGDYLDHVALYRNSGKTVYNTLSKQYRDIELRPGDMVVVDEWHDSDGFDPFSAVAPSEPEDRGPIVRDADVWVSEDPIAGNSEGGGGQESRAAAGSIQIVDPAEAGMPDLVAFEEKLAAGADPWAAYLEIKAGQLRPTRFHIEAARRLFAAGHDALAMRVLSTLVERGNGSGAALRAMAFWLMEFGKMEEADRVLAEISTEPGGCPASYARAELAGPDLERIARLKSALKPVWSGSEIVLADLTRLENQNPAGNMPADIRITVIGQFPGAVPDVEIVEPTGAIVSGWKISPTGGRLTKAEGLAEYLVRRAVPGTYRVKLSSKLDTSFRIAIHTDWGRDSQKTVRMTRLVEAGEPEMVAELEFEFAAE